MSEAEVVSMKLLDGTALRSLQLTFPANDAGTNLTGAQVFDFVESKASSSLSAISLPQSLKSSALRRLNLLDDVNFRESVLPPDVASKTAVDYLSSLADELKDNPLVVSFLDGSNVKLVLEDEDDFAMIAENVFTELDIEDKGKITKSKIRNALAHMGVEMGIPPFEEFPALNGILKQHGAEGEDELGQSQFAELLQSILQEVSDALSKKPVPVVLNIKVFNGSRLRKLLADENQLEGVVEKIFQENKTDTGYGTETIRRFLEKNGQDLGLPPPEASEAVVLLYDTVFAEVESDKNNTKVADEFKQLAEEIFEKLAKQLDENPLYCDLN